MASTFDVDRFQTSFVRITGQKDRLAFEGRQEMVDDLAVLLEVVYAGFRQSEALNQILTDIKQEIHAMAGELDTLKAQVASNTSVIESAKQLIQGLGAALDAAIAANNAGDPVALATLSANLKTEDDSLAAAVAARTPVAPQPVPVPPPAPGVSTAPTPAPGGTGGGQPATQPVGTSAPSPSSVTTP
jgi:prophage DNA circulation protein